MTHLLEPLALGELRLKNRLVMPPMATHRSNPDGSMSDALFAYYDEKSRDDAMGLIITEHCYVAPEGQFRRNQPSAADDAMLPGLARLAEIIHANGPKAVLQINHSGGAASSEITGLPVVAPSAIPSPVSLGGEIPRPLARDEIQAIVSAFGAAAGRAKAAGFDGVEIHSAHGYLLNQFYSPLTNERADEYGGGLDRRIRIHLEVISAVREAVGADFPVFLRLGACDYRDGGSTIADAVEACMAFEAAGVDVLDISGGMSSYFQPPGYPEQGYFADVSEAVRAAVSVPVILTGGITDIRVADQLLVAGKADLIGVGRAIMKDSSWAAEAIRLLQG